VNNYDEWTILRLINSYLCLNLKFKFMKKLYTLSLTLLAFATATFAQRDLRAQLVTPTSGSNNAPGTFNVEFNIVNNGPEAINAGDTIWVGYWVGNDLFSISTGTANGVDGLIIPAGVSIPSGQSLPWSVITQVTGPCTVTVSGQTTDVCAWVAGVGHTALSATGDANDPNLVNNFDCFDVSLALYQEEIAATEKLAIEMYEFEGKVYVTTGLDVSFGQLTVTNLMGQTVETFTHNNNYSIYELGHLSAGVYILNLTTPAGKSATQKITIK
jgi:hypothetical protein